MIAVLLNAVVTFLSSDRGGRTAAPASGYRPPVWFGDNDDSGEPILWDFEFTFPGSGRDERVPFNREVPTTMRAGLATSRDVVVRSGTSFEVREGSRVVGRGRVVEMVAE